MVCVYCTVLYTMVLWTVFPFFQLLRWGPASASALNSPPPPPLPPQCHIQFQIVLTNATNNTHHKKRVDAWLMVIVEAQSQHNYSKNVTRSALWVERTYINARLVCYTMTTYHVTPSRRCCCFCCRWSLCAYSSLLPSFHHHHSHCTTTTTTTVQWCSESSTGNKAESSAAADGIVTCSSVDCFFPLFSSF